MKKLCMMTAVVVSLGLAACGGDTDVASSAESIEAINQATAGSKSVTKATTKTKQTSSTVSDIKSTATNGKTSGKATAVKKSADEALKYTTEGSTANTQLKKASEKAGSAAETLGVFEMLGGN